MPPRSPIPLIVPCTQEAPARTAATAAAVARPKSLWPWKWTGTSGPSHSRVLADQVRDRLGRGDSDRVDDDRLLRARLDRGLVGLPEEREVGARAVDAEERDRDPVLRRERDRVGDPLEHRLARDAERIELRVGDRRLDHAACTPSSTSASTSAGPRARSPTPRRRGRRRRSASRRPSRPARRAGSRPRSARSRASRWRGRARASARVEDDADGLLAVAERRVVEADRAADAAGVVDSDPVQIRERSLIRRSRPGSGRASPARPR